MLRYKFGDIAIAHDLFMLYFYLLNCLPKVFITEIVLHVVTKKNK